MHDSRRSRSWALVKPYHADAEYVSFDRTVALYTVCRLLSLSPWARSVRSANNAWLQDAIVVSMWREIDNVFVNVTPRILLESALATFGSKGGISSTPSFGLLCLNIISTVLDGLSRRLFLSDHSLMLFSSASRVLTCLAAIIRMRSSAYLLSSFLESSVWQSDAATT